MAIAQDGNSNILPVAFAIVEGETKEAWSFFLTNLRIHVAPQEGICVISDRHESIKAAINQPGSGWQPPSAYHVFCIRHIANNFMTKFKDADARRYLKNIGYAKTRKDFAYWYQKFCIDERYKHWIDNIPKEQWTLLYDGGRRYGHTTTNLAECVNSMLKGTRNLPITALAKSTFYRLAALFAKRGRDASAQSRAGHGYCETVRNAIQESQNAARSMPVREFSSNHKKCEVEEQDDPHYGGKIMHYRVDLSNRTCDCGEFQVFRYPCRHAIAACAYFRFDCTVYIDDVYKLESIRKVYEMEFEPIGNEGNWPQYDGPVLVPDSRMLRSRKGRPKSTRIRNGMDMREKGQPKLCTLCRTEGHMRNSCPNVA